MPIQEKSTLSKEQHECAQNLPTLVQLLQVHPSEQSKTDAAKEARLLEQLCTAFGSAYDFTTSSTPAVAQQISNAFDVLVEHRLHRSERRSVLREDHLLRVLQAVRLLTRDTQLRKTIVSAGALQDLCAVFAAQAELHFSGRVTPFQVELLTELASIAKRLAGDEWGLAAMVASDMPQVLITLLHSTDPAILPLVLVALIGFATHREHSALVSHGSVLNLLLRIVAEYDPPFKRLAADLLALLSRRESVVSDLLELNCLGRFVGQLSGVDTALTASLLRVVCYMASDSRAMLEFYQTGTIPVLLSLVSSVLRDAGVGTSSSSSSSSGLTSARITDMQLVCTALTRISEDDELAGAIRTANGVTLLGKLLLVTPPQQGADIERSTKELSGLYAYVLRTLRFLFSVERNRKVFKRLFPPDFFASFIDVGHYNASLAAYANLVQRVEEFGDKARTTLATALDDISADRDITGEQGALKTVYNGQYIILEMLGKGAYGAVYKARRSRGDALVALKEVPLSDIGLFGATQAERDQGVGRMGKEVDILSSMSHPHIVQYYESFAEGPYLYIAMELVEGVSLLDHLNSLTEKGRKMPEQDIWQVLLAVCLALHYIHSVAKVVHRDLTPANIMLGQGADGLRHAKIADFGLAKRLQGSVITAQSVVGTMPYTCPEIIQQEQYSEKADVWSLGCVLYHCMCLKPPFDGNNPLSVASKIVEGAYDQISDSTDGPAYSLHLKQLQRLMMTVDPHKRPGMDEVAALVSGQLMSALERLTASEQRLQRALALERAHHRRGQSAGMMVGFLDTPPQHTPTNALFATTTTATMGGAMAQSPMATAVTNAGSTTPAGSPIRQGGGTGGGPGSGGMVGSPFALGTLRTRRQMLDPLQPVSAGTQLMTANSLGAGGGGGAASPLSGALPISSPFSMLAMRGPGGTGGTDGAWGGNVRGEVVIGDMDSAGSGNLGTAGWDQGGGAQTPSGMGSGAMMPGTPGRLVSLATSRLRPVSDPLAQMLGQLHKIMWVEQQPPGLTRDTRRRCIEAFRRALFGPGTSAGSLKAHLAKLQVCDADVIRDAQGRPVEFGSASLGPEGSSQPIMPTEGCLTYEQLAHVLEGFLQEKGYWSQQGLGGGSGPMSVGYSPMQTVSTRASGPGGGIGGGGGGSGVNGVGVEGGGGTDKEGLNDQLPPSSFGAASPAAPGGGMASQGGALPAGGAPGAARRLSSLRH